ncbi:hypothetical protein [Saccharophagus degradans]|uniref:Uncharacterized protein n=1 Tax=Saccharophagus degradans TaxID=86304 RepID=A0AAW7X3T3_9GAMM|nr:hypothetical protein [Saccharophagus degradans]MDO6421069.1 hypothetical protein [Saccharophagus degradans]MDO6606020.1 hypothetical protein [Saccharophagus degradans]
MNNVHKPLIIAGHNSGIPVELNPVQAEFYRNLETQARQGSYWASILIKDLQSLSSGHVKRNVFVTDGPADASYKNFEMILPGCRANVMKCSNGKYLVYKMTLDVNYPSLQADGTKPSLHHVKGNNRGEWTTRFKQDGKISPIPTPIVAISDGGYDLRASASNCANYVSNSQQIGTRAAEQFGFDMHYTPGKKIGGLRQINQALHAATDISLYESAALLARTMEQSIDTESVTWFTQGGGSGVFTQAMDILSKKNITFEDTGHTVFFSHPTTSYLKAQSLAIKLGLEFDRDNLSIRPHNLDETIGGLHICGDFIAGYQRRKYDPEYTALNYGVDSLKGIHRNWQAITVGVGCSAALSAAVSAGGTSAVYPAVLAAATAMTGLGHTLFQSWLPERYQQLKKKL